MAKVSSDTTEISEKAPRKRAVRRVVSKADAPVRRTRVTAKREVASEPVVVSRKAPTRVMAQTGSNRFTKKIIPVIVIMLLVSGTAAWIGFSDGGQIDVNAQISEANERVGVATETVTNEDGSTTMEVPVQNAPISVEGLRGRGVGTPPVAQESQPVPTEDTTASSSDETASSTVEASEEESVPDSGTEIPPTE